MPTASPRLNPPGLFWTTEDGWGYMLNPSPVPGSHVWILSSVFCGEGSTPETRIPKDLCELPDTAYHAIKVLFDHYPNPELLRKENS